MGDKLLAGCKAEGGMEGADATADGVVGQMAGDASTGVGLVAEEIDEPIDEAAINVPEEDVLVVALEVLSGGKDIVAEGTGAAVAKLMVLELAHEVDEANARAERAVLEAGTGIGELEGKVGTHLLGLLHEEGIGASDLGRITREEIHTEEAVGTGAIAIDVEIDGMAAILERTGADGDGRLDMRTMIHERYSGKSVSIRYMASVRLWSTMEA